MYDEVILGSQRGHSEATSIGLTYSSAESAILMSKFVKRRLCKRGGFAGCDE